ncbi:hypothetical protein [Paracoccus fistulariae]|uniref:Transcriptional regulator n=1 Tax=Paracoccus fistulariae TaxID=658446 RepID=A0ABY7SPB7_9RHOB|nr:hypothetical protein [Paracoccus fistulariae]MDB6183038.1 hypothetical protein [Paracoccus fistulariae]WCR08833.1 hypothetical protein JHX87_08605 [Paracoccus fistulariae]
MGEKPGDDGGNAAQEEQCQLIGRLWDEGLASGPAASGTTMADIKAEARRNHDQDGAAPGLR